jgi:transposase
MISQSLFHSKFKFMQNQTFIGIDINSATLDICVITPRDRESLIISNTVRDIRKFFRNYKKEQLIIAMENTGRYNWLLYEVLAGCGHKVFVISPLHLKRSMGLQRGKNDKVDAIRIASFIEKNHEELKPWECPAAAITKLKVLLTERNSRIKMKRQLTKQQHDYVKMASLGLDKNLLKLNRQLLEQIEKQINNLEEQIQQVINADKELKTQVSLMQSVPGVGKVLSWVMLAKTEGFKQITDPRKMACYSGVVPFDNQSGTSLRGKTRVSVYADKYIKSILHLAAMSAIRLENDLRQYYLRKVGEGKNKMSVLNAVRNKIIHRIYAVIKNQKEYQKDLQLS